MEKDIPVLFTKKEECCGCGACFSVCAKNAIEMISDREGFLYPQINAEKCVRCGACISVCIYK